MKTDAARRVAGFTLIEILVSIALLGILIVIVGYFSNSLTATSQAKSYPVAQTFASSYLNVLRTKWAVPGQYRTTSLPDPTTNEVKPSTGFSYVTAVTDGTTNAPIISYAYPNAAPPVPVANNSVLKRVTLSVTTPQNKTFVFATQFVNPPQ